MEIRFAPRNAEVIQLGNVRWSRIPIGKSKSRDHHFFDEFCRTFKDEFGEHDQAMIVWDKMGEEGIIYLMYHGIAAGYAKIVQESKFFYQED